METWCRDKRTHFTGKETTSCIAFNADFTRRRKRFLICRSCFTKFITVLITVLSCEIGQNGVFNIYCLPWQVRDPLKKHPNILLWLLLVLQRMSVDIAKRKWSHVPRNTWSDWISNASLMRFGCIQTCSFPLMHTSLMTDVNARSELGPRWWTWWRVHLLCVAYSHFGTVDVISRKCNAVFKQRCTHAACLCDCAQLWLTWIHVSLYSKCSQRKQSSKTLFIIIYSGRLLSPFCCCCSIISYFSSFPLHNLV